MLMLFSGQVIPSIIYNVLKRPDQPVDSSALNLLHQHPFLTSTYFNHFWRLGINTLPLFGFASCYVTHLLFAQSRAG